MTPSKFSLNRKTPQRINFSLRSLLWIVTIIGVLMGLELALTQAYFPYLPRYVIPQLTLVACVPIVIGYLLFGKWGILPATTFALMSVFVIFAGTEAAYRRKAKQKAEEIKKIEGSDLILPTNGAISNRLRRLVTEGLQGRGRNQDDC